MARNGTVWQDLPDCAKMPLCHEQFGSVFVYIPPFWASLLSNYLCIYLLSITMYISKSISMYVLVNEKQYIPH
jgi:hypothetical protein